MSLLPMTNLYVRLAPLSKFSLLCLSFTLMALIKDPDNLTTALMKTIPYADNWSPSPF